MNEQIPNEQAAHAAKFRQVTHNLKAVAAQLVAAHPEFPAGDFGRAYFAVALTLMLGAVGDATTATWLREIADQVERGERPALN